MADAIINKVQDICEGSIDFQGQKQTELITTGLIAVSGIVAFIVGYIQQNVYYTLWTGLLGTFLTFLVVVPPWPIWNQKPERWLASTQKTGGVTVSVDGKKVN